MILWGLIDVMNPLATAIFAVALIDWVQNKFLESGRYLRLIINRRNNFYDSSKKSSHALNHEEGQSSKDFLSILK